MSVFESWSGICEGKQIFDGNAENFSNVHCKLERWIVFAAFKVYDRFSSCVHQFSQFGLFQPGFFAVFPDFGYKCHLNPLLRPYSRTGLF